MSLYGSYGPRATHIPQTQPIPGQNMVPNHAGGYTYKVSTFTQFRRWLILGSTASTYYIGKRELTRENIGVLEEILKAGDGRAAIDEIVRVSKGGLAVSNETALFALARCAACDVHPKRMMMPAKGKTYTLHEDHHPNLFSRLEDGGTLVTKNSNVLVREGDIIRLTTPSKEEEKAREVLHSEDIAIRQYAFSVLGDVARTGTHILHFVSYLDQFRGWGHGARTAIANWYQKKREFSLAIQLIKYQERDKWRQRDILRLAHPKAATPLYNDLFHWVTKGWESVGEEPHPDPVLRTIWAYETAKKETEPERVAYLVQRYQLPREAIPTQFLQSVPVWEALMEQMGMEAMVRNLAKMTREGVLAADKQSRDTVLARLRDRTRIRNERLHPMKLLSALLTYSGGKSLAGDATWTPIGPICDALNDAFYLAFDSIEPTGKKILVIVDTSGSTHYSMVNNHLSGKDISKNEFPGLSMHQGAAAMALLFMRGELDCEIIGVDTSLHPLPIAPLNRMDVATKIIATYGGGGTSLELPLENARQRNKKYDAFICITDGETWGHRHVTLALQAYRQTINKDAKWIHVQMAPTHVTTFDPKDPLALDVCGFDTSVPLLINSFLRGDF